MKKTYLPLLLLLTILSAFPLTGCGGSKKQTIVQEKTELNTDGYQQTPGDDISNHGNDLADRLLVPENDTFCSQFEGDTFQLSCQAKVAVPDVDQVSVYKVRQMPFDQTWIDRITEVFFGDCPVYDYEKYNRLTRNWIRKKLQQLKEFRAEGNTDPYGYIASAREAGYENPELFYSLQAEIERWEQIYETAPESREKAEVSPGLNISAAGDATPFSGIVEMDNSSFLYKLNCGGAFHMDIDISRGHIKDSDDIWTGASWFQPYWFHTALPPGDSAPTVEEAEEMAGITSAHAIKMTDQYMKELGLSDFSAKHVELSLCSPHTAMSLGNPGYRDAAYLVIYTRDIQGFSITPDVSDGGVRENTGDAAHTWGYEKVEFYVNQEGLQKASLQNIYIIEEQLINNVELMSFPEITGIFEQIMPIHFKNNTDKINIDRITLGYMKIYDPGLDSTTGLLVPVWDFFGSREMYNPSGGEPYTMAYPTASFLTINAADGSVINRNYGY